MALKAVRFLLGHGQVPMTFLVNDSQTIEAGDILQITGGKVSVAGDAQAAGTVAGVAMEAITTVTAGDDDKIAVDVNPFTVYKADFTGSGTPAIGTSYDLSDDPGIFDADDSTEGYIRVIGNVDTTADTADVLVCNRMTNIG